MDKNTNNIERQKFQMLDKNLKHISESIERSNEKLIKVMETILETLVKQKEKVEDKNNDIETINKEKRRIEIREKLKNIIYGK